MEETIIENKFEKLKNVKNIIDVKDIIENEFTKMKNKIKDKIKVVSDENIVKLCHPPMQFKRGIYESRYANTVDLINLFRKNTFKYMKYKKDNINVCN